MTWTSCFVLNTVQMPRQCSFLPAQFVHWHVVLRKYGCNICGEGGEFETLTLDCPVFRQASIVLDAWQPLLHSEDSVARVGVLHPTHFHVKAKGGTDVVVTIATGDVTEVTSEGTVSCVVA